MEIEFDFRKENSPIFGEILRPVARVILCYNGKELADYFYIDSGADSSLIPKSVGDWLGFTIDKDDTIMIIKGIVETGLPIIMKKLTMKIGQHTSEVRIAWALIEDVPMLLGRQDIFTTFDICFRNNLKIIFQKNDSLVNT